MRRAALMIVDGLRADMVTPEYTPALAALAERSRVYAQHRSVFPSATRVSSASIATGCLPASHGLEGNAIALDEGQGLEPVSVGPATFRERWRAATGATLRRPTLSERLRERGGVYIYSNSSPGSAHMQDPDSHGHLLHRSGSFAPDMVPIDEGEHPDVGYDAAGDAVVTERFCASLGRRHDVPLHVLWICEPDHSQHELELGSPEHREVLAGADARVAEVVRSFEAAGAWGEELMLIVGSDHGHETVAEVVPVTELLMAAGYKRALDSRELVVASSGMGALIYMDGDAMRGASDVAAWLRRQSWCGDVYAGDELKQVGHATTGPLAIAFSMAKRDAPNRHGVRGYGHVAGDPFMPNDRPGRGQHGGLGPYETRPFLMATGGDVRRGICDRPTSTIDIAPTVLEHLGLLDEGAARSMDGTPLPLV
ncbi:MAG: alkaline phosphatase family protein [Gammaproteobacteria bacterium]